MFLLPASNTFAFDLFGNSCTGNAANSPVCKDAANKGGSDPIAGSNGIIQTAANLIALVTGIAAVAMIIIGGFTYITSAGNAEKVATARRRIIYSMIGLAIVAFAWVITSFIVSRLVNT